MRRLGKELGAEKEVGRVAGPELRHLGYAFGYPRHSPTLSSRCVECF